jgi:hypothetical protein
MQKTSTTTRIRFVSLFFALGAYSLACAQPTSAQFERIASLVEDGQFEEAQIRTETLLEFYPSDPALIEIQSLLRTKAITGSTHGDQSLISVSTASPELQITPVPEVLSPEEQSEVDLFSQQLGAAVKLQDSNLRKQALRRLLDRAVHRGATISPAWEPYWRGRAIAALELDDAIVGCRAAQSLKALNARLGPDPERSALLDSLNAKGWLDAEFVAKVEALAGEYARWIGTWIGQGRQEGRKNNIWFAVRIYLSSNLEILAQCEGNVENEPQLTEVNWMIIKGSFALPGHYSSEMWVGDPGEYDLNKAMYFPPTENGSFRILSHTFSADKRELTIRYRYDAKQGFHKDAELALILSLSESDDTLTLKQGLNIVLISPLYIKVLTRP